MGIEETKKGISGSTLKLIAITVMLIDHIAAVVLDRYVMYLNMNGRPFIGIYGIDMMMRLIGRLGFPIFVFLLVEGFTYTHNKWKYLRNLLIFATISEIPFNLALEGKVFSLNYQSVFLTLAIGLLALIGIKASFDKTEWHKLCKFTIFPSYFISGAVASYFLEKWICDFFGFDYGILGIPYYIAAGAVVTLGCFIYTRLWTVEKKTSLAFALLASSACVVLAEVLKTDYSGSGVIVIIAMYATRKYGYVKEGLVGCILLTLMQFVEVTSFFILIPLRHYNGKRGINLKYFFYAFYPVHLLILFFICVLMGTV